MKKIWYLTGMMLVASNAGAVEAIAVQSDEANPTVVYGEAETAAGTFNEVTVRQAADAPNPFGDPIVNTLPYGKQDDRVMKVQSKTPTPEKGEHLFNVISQDSEQNPQISPQNSPQNMQNQIQNTLYESDNRIYDLQSYPETDINQIENQGNAVTNYPEY